MAILAYANDPFSHLGRPRTEEWLDEHQVFWDHATGILPSIILGVYRRASTLNQVGGYRQQSMLEDMTDTVLHLGPAFGVVIFDEGNRSGTTLSGRRVALSMIRALEDGVIDGIATPDAKRLSRDQYLGGGREIVQAVRKRKAMLVLGRGDVVNLRNYRERKQFERELRDASDEIGEIRQTFYSGWAARARRVAEGRVEPMFRGPAPFGYEYVECRDEHGEVIRHRGVPRRTLAKYDVDEPGVARMIELFDTQPTLNAVARVLNREDVGRRIHKGALSKGWNAQRLLGAIENPVYHGVWRAIREKSSDLWDDFDEADLTVPVPHLAYWTLQQSQDWQRKFKPPINRRMRVYNWPFLGLIQCNSCHATMTSGGRHGYRCRWVTVQRQGMVQEMMCTDPQTLSGAQVAAELRRLFVENINTAAAEIIREHEQQKRDAAVDPIADELAVLDTQEAALIDLALERNMSPQVKARYDWLLDRRAQLLKLRERQQPTVRLSDDQVAMISQLSDDPAAVYDELSETEQAEVWRLWNVQVRIWRVGGGGPYTRYESEILKANDSHNDVRLWIVSSYVTGKGVLGEGVG